MYVSAPIYLLRLIEDARSPADGCVAYGHFVRTVHVDCAVLYQHLERLRRIFFSFFSPNLSRTNPPPAGASSSPTSSKSRTGFAVPSSDDS